MDSMLTLLSKQPYLSLKLFEMKKIKLSIIAASAGLLLGGCKKGFFDINQNPNQATETSITPELATVPQLLASANRNASTYDVLNRWMGFWSASGSFSRSTVEMSYNISNSTFQGTWDGLYYSIKQYKSIEKKAEALGWKFYQGLAMIMQAHEMAVLVDLFGNAPYTQASDLGTYLRPAYDKAEDIYKDLLPKIDAGLALIKAADGKDVKIASVDIMFKGDKVKWAKLANTLKLRLLLHCVKTTTFDAAAEVAKIRTEGSGFLGNGLSASVQPGFTADKPNPYYNNHIFASNGNDADTYNRANNFVLDLMKNLSDERYKRFFKPAKSLAGQYRGTNYGQDPADDVNSDRTSGPGFGLLSVDGDVPGTNGAAQQPMWLITSVEGNFLQAEAIARGWDLGTSKTALQAYTEAVTESFTYLKVPNAAATAATYLTGIDSKIAWPAAQADQIAVIIWQKYFALNGLQANEVFTDYRRLDVLVLPLSIAPERQGRLIPVRYLYPTKEYELNAANVTAEGEISITSKIFWDK